MRQSNNIGKAEPDAAAPVLRVPRSIMQQIVEHLRAALPNEGCGLIAARQLGGTEIVALRFFPGTNADASPVRFTMDDVEVVNAFRTMRELDLELAAIVHSHPESEPKLSETDFEEAYYPGALMLIVSFAGEKAEFRAWRIAADSVDLRAIESPIVLC